MSLNITVKFKNETEKYELLDNAVVEDLMKAIEERTQIPINYQKVIFRGKPLQPLDATLQSLHIQNNAKLLLMTNYPPPLAKSKRK